MNKRKKRINVVYSTNKNFNYEYEDNEENVTIDKEKQKIRLHLERLKGNKTATIIKGFSGSKNEINNLAKILKTYCGVGGNAKDDYIILQGNVREKALKKLLEEGYKNVKLSGG